jgi:hypothetical protein
MDFIDAWLSLTDLNSERKVYPDTWVEFGIRQLEDYLLVHAAFQAQYPDES